MCVKWKCTFSYIIFAGPQSLSIAQPGGSDTHHWPVPRPSKGALGEDGGPGPIGAPQEDQCGVCERSGEDGGDG